MISFQNCIELMPRLVVGEFAAHAGVDLVAERRVRRPAGRPSSRSSTSAGLHVAGQVLVVEADALGVAGLGEFCVEDELGVPRYGRKRMRIRSVGRRHAGFVVINGDQLHEVFAEAEIENQMYSG